MRLPCVPRSARSPNKRTSPPRRFHRVLNDYPYVDEATRTAVLRAAEALGYAVKPASADHRRPKSVLLLARTDDMRA